MRPLLRIAPLSLAALLLLSCGAGAPAPRRAPSWARALPADLDVEGTLSVRPDAGDEPPIELRFPWRNDAAMLGWGGAHLWARPRTDHVSVTAILDAPSEARRWTGCDEVVLITDGREEHLGARYIGRALEEASMVYEAAHVHLGVQHLRAIAAAADARARVCGDTLTFSAPQQRTIGRFVEWFDHLAARRWYGEEPYFRDVGPRPAIPFEDELDPEPMNG